MSCLRSIGLAAALGLAMGCLAALLIVAPAQADDLNPPPWMRLGQANFSTSAEWDFLTGADPFFPDGTEVPLIVGDFAAQLDSAFPAGDPHPSGVTSGNVFYTGSGWQGGILGGGAGGDGGGTGGALAFNVPNWIDTEPLKRIRIQVTWDGPTEPTTDVFGFNGIPGEPVSKTFVEHVVDTFPQPSAPPLKYFYDVWELRPNPDWEQVVVNVPEGTTIEQVVIDTISLPEPSAWVLLAIGLVGVALGSRARGLPAQ